jgi:hypothetical protein
MKCSDIVQPLDGVTVNTAAESGPGSDGSVSVHERQAQLEGYLP